MAQSHASLTKCKHCAEKGLHKCNLCGSNFCMFHNRNHKREGECHTLQESAATKTQKLESDSKSVKPARVKNDKAQAETKASDQHQQQVPAALDLKRQQSHKTFTSAGPQEEGARNQPNTSKRDISRASMKSNYSKENAPAFSEKRDISRASMKSNYSKENAPAFNEKRQASLDSESQADSAVADLRECDVCFNKKAVKTCITCQHIYCEYCCMEHIKDMDGHQLQPMGNRTQTYQHKDKSGHLPGKIEFSSVTPDSVSLKFIPPKGTSVNQKFKLTYRGGAQNPLSVMLDSPEMEVTELSPGELYHFLVVAIDENGCEQLCVGEQIYTAIPPPENLTVETHSSKVKITWTKPDKVNEVAYVRKLLKEQKCIKTSHSANTSSTFKELQPGNYTISVFTVVKNGNLSKPISKPFRIGPGLSDLLSKFAQRRITLSSVLEISNYTMSDKPAENLKDLPKTFLSGLMSVNINARNIRSIQKCLSKPDHLNPLDLITALFHCSDPFLQQEMVTKMAMCQFAVPLLLPNYDTQQCTLILWAMRDIVKKYRPHFPEGKPFVQGRIVETNIPMVSFIRLGESSLSKSQCLNKLLSNAYEQNNAFFHRDMESGDVPRRISDGLVEVSWYLPCGNRSTDIFTQPVAIANLRGDGMLCNTQITFLCQASAAVFIFSDDFERGLSTLTSIKREAKLYLVTNCQSQIYSKKTLRDECQKHNISEKSVIKKESQNDAEFVKIIHSYVSGVIANNKSMKIVDMADLARQTDIQVDEHSTDCVKGREYAERICKSIKDIPRYMIDEMPLHGQMWRRISKLEQEMDRMKEEGNGQDINKELQNEIDELRIRQRGIGLLPAMEQFIDGISQSKVVRLFFFKWLRILLYNLCYHNTHKWKKSFHGIAQAKETEVLGDQIFNSLIGPEHFFRELGQIYECACSLSDNKVNKFPHICAQMLLDGFPVEMFDGDASNIPVKWISEVLSHLHHLLKTKNRILVLTVLGKEGTGKSTLLNTMFGVQFAVSRERCTTGASMILIKISEELDLQCDFIMLIDTEGLKSPELTVQDTSNESKRLTFVVGLSDIIITTFAMDNITEMKEILQILVLAAIKRKYGERKKPKCLFVHQSMSSMPAHDINMMDRKELAKLLNEMTQIAAKMQKKDEQKFTDIINYDPEKDSYYIPGLLHGSSLMSPVNVSYSEAVSQLKKRLLASLETSDDIGKTDAEEIIKWTTDLWHSVRSEDLIFKLRNPMITDAFTKLRDEYEEWESSFRSTFQEWKKKQNIKRGDIPESQLTKLSLEAATILDKEEALINKKLKEYFAINDHGVRLVREYKYIFKSCITRLREETEEDAAKILGVAKEKMEEILPGTIRKKAKKLRDVCDEKNKIFAEDGKEKERLESMRECIANTLSPVFLPEQDVCQRVLAVLFMHFEENPGHVKELTKHSLKDCGVENLNLKKSKHVKKHDHKHQKMCDDLIKDCEHFLNIKEQSNNCFNETYIKHVLDMVDKKVKGQGMSIECEVLLKLHVCGKAVRVFQRVHKSICDATEHANQIRMIRNKIERQQSSIP